MMNLFKRFLLIAGASLLTLSPVVSAAPAIGIGSIYDVLTPGMQSMTKRIYNTGDSTAFVRVELLEIHPSKKEAQETPQKETINNQLEKNRLIVTPLRLIIPPAGFQAVRIMWPGEREKERYFRVRFTPVMPEVDDSFGLNKQAMDEYRKNSLHAGLNVLAGYGSVVIVQPDSPTFKTVMDNNSAAALTVKNNGDTTISLEDIRHCKSINTDCSPVTREFILPGRSVSLDKKPGYKTNFTLIEGNNKRTLTF